MYPGLIGDTKAAELMDAIDYDFSSIKRILAFGVLEGAMRGYDLVTETRRYFRGAPVCRGGEHGHVPQVLWPQGRPEEELPEADSQEAHLILLCAL